MPDYLDVPREILAELRPLCLGLPETYEEPAWAGIRWRIRKRTFAHVLTIGPVTKLTMRATIPELDALTSAGHPFYRPDWGLNVLGVIIDGDTDWDEITELLTESYCIQAPKKLAGLVDRPA